MSKEVYCNSNVSQMGVWGRSPQPPKDVGVWERSLQLLGDFFVIFRKKKLFQYHCITFHTYLEPFQNTRFLTFESQLKKLSCLVLLLLAIFKSKTRLISCILGLNFVSDLAQVRGIKAHCLLQYFGSK